MRKADRRERQDDRLRAGPLADTAFADTALADTPLAAFVSQRLGFVLAGLRHRAHRTRWVRSVAYARDVVVPQGFRIGRLDHVHIRVPDRAAAAAWYAEHLGFEPVAEYDFWATEVDGGPLQISADGGGSMLALFEASDRAPMVAQEQGVAFSVDADTFIAFARSLPGEIPRPDGEALTIADLVDFDLCFAFDIADPWGNRYEINCYDHAVVQRALVFEDGVTPDRKWPAADD
jgi:catechol 2,3-dioxygenase-like lactoylglutathione lyase family enzyme